MTDPTSLAAVLAGSDVYRRGPVELRLGDYREVLLDVEPDAVIADTPYSAKTHAGALSATGERGVNGYGAWDNLDACAFVERWAHVPGWLVIHNDDVLGPHLREVMEQAGRRAFPLLPVLQHMPRLQGDGPGQHGHYLAVSRPRAQRFLGWGSLPGWYEAGRDGSIVKGGKPLSLMRVIVRDYSRPGDLVCDPCAGGGTTLLAAALEGRRAIGAELDPETFKKACKRLDDEAGRIATAQLRWQGPERKRKPKQAGLCFDTPEAAE